MKNDVIGECAICNKNGKLTYEHIPPKGANNSKPKLYKGHEELFKSSSPKFGKNRIARKGFGFQCLCEQCNNFLGANYVNDYIDFAKQCSIQNIKKKKINDFQLYDFQIKPLNVFKQIVSMFVCVNRGCFNEVEKEILKEFLLNKESKTFIDKYKIYLFSVNSNSYKFTGLQVSYNSGTIIRCSEIAYAPFGFQFTFDSQPSSPYYQIINDFLFYDYNKLITAKIALPLSEVKSVFVGE